MRKNKFLIRVMSLILTLMFVIGVAVPAGAANTVQLTLKSKDYQNGAFTDSTHFSAGETVYVALETTAIASLGGITLKLNFDKDLFTFREQSSFAVMNDGKGELYFNNNEGVVTAVWETTLSDTAVVAGPMIYFVFESNKDITENSTGSFSVTVSEMFDGSTAQKNISFAAPAAINVTLVTQEIPANKLSLFEALETISYPSSMDDIVKAEEAFAAFTGAQQATFKAKYSKLYEYFTTARTRYYKLAEQATLDSVLAEVKAFETNYADVLSLTPETVTLADAARVKEAANALEGMSSVAKTKLSEAKKQLVAELKARVLVLEAEDKATNEAKTEIEEFRQSYTQLFDDEDITQYFETSHTLYSPLVSEAILVYGILSEKAQEILEPEYKQLQEWREMLDTVIANDKREQEIVASVSDFQQQYIDVFKLNVRNVELNDETAIKMALAAYKKIEDKDVAERLSPKIKILESLLKVIDSLKVVEEEDPDDQENIVVVEKEVVKVETVEKEVEKEVEVEKIVTETVEKNTQSTKLLETGFSTNIWIMLILLSVSVLLGIATFYVHYLSQKKEREIDE